MCVAEGVDVEDVDVGWGEEDVLDELCGLSVSFLRVDVTERHDEIRLTEVNMCQGSKKRIDMIR